MDIRIYFFVLVLLVAPLFVPKYKIAKEVKIPFPAKINNSFLPGAVVSFKPLNQGNYYLNGAKMDLLKNGEIYGVAGLNREAHTVFSFSKNTTSFFSLHPIIEYSYKNAELEVKKLKSGSVLRLPASVLQKLEAGPKSLRRLQAEEMYKILNEKPSTPLSFDCWQQPVLSKTVSEFGSPRTLPRGRSYYHTGVDLRAWTGTKIIASGPGKVVFAKENIVPGKTVVLDHGGGVFSRYLHLSEFKVNQGDFVNRGDLIGLSGSTGRVEAPHLHWEILWKGNHANPKKFLQFLERFCDPK